MEEPTRPDEQQTAPVRQVGLQIRVLVVDDEPDLCDYLERLLEREGYSVTKCIDPHQATTRLRETQYHLVILDMMMPGVSGTELLEQIRKFDSDIAIIVSTAYPTVETAVASLQHAVSDYLRKPFEPQDFLATVQDALARKGLSTDPEADLHLSVGKIIREVRKKQNLTLKHLARRTGLSVSLLSQIERAESSASISSLFKVASALRLRMADLFGAC